MKSLITLAVLLSSTVLGSNVTLGSNITLQEMVDPQECYNALYSSDSNGDGKVNSTEYITVNQILGPDGFVANVTSFQDLPLVIQGTFIVLACQCTSFPNATTDCCMGDNANLNIDGTAPGQTPTEEQMKYLDKVCLRTVLAIQASLGTEAPTFSPSMSPTRIENVFPTTSPSTSPLASSVPSQVASAAPSKVASAAPSKVASGAPSEVASAAPTEVASAAPSTTPTEIPTSMPQTLPPVSSAPSMKESSVPTGVVTAVPSSTPTDKPSTMAPTSPLVPTAKPSSIVDVAVEVSYKIGIENGENVIPPNYVTNLEQAMDILAPQVVDETFNGSDVNIQFPTAVVLVSNQTCPTGTAPADLCQEITASVTLLVTEYRRTRRAAEGRRAVGSSAAAEIYQGALMAAIEEGRLQTALDEVNPQSNVRILTVSQATLSPTSSPIVGSDGLSGGAIGGIVVAAAVSVILFGILAYRRGHREDKVQGAFFPGSSQQALQQADDRNVPPGAETLGATTPDYGKKSKKDATTAVDLEEGLGTDDAPTPLLLNESNDSSSNAGDSGWSSSAGVSSLRSGSFESMEADTVPGGSTLAAIGVASGMAVGTTIRDSDGVDSGAVTDLPVVTRDDLDSAIDAGDWAAVGATAALLAAASDSQSFSSRSGRSRRSGNSASRGGSSMSSMDAARAAELDHLVDAGDWEGVVLAAAKFEATEDSSSKASHTGGSATGSSQYSGTGSQGYSPSTSVSESASKIQKRDEIREEVEALVRRVVPEEIGNVDEMMMQFKGREEELVETLRTMQERQVAQKARVQGQKQAKRDAKMTVAAGGAGLPAASPASGTIIATGGGISGGAAAGIAIGTAAAVGVAAGLAVATDSDDESSSHVTDEAEVSSYAGLQAAFDTGDALGVESSETESDHSNKGRRTALELAIEAGDWEAVGEAAAMMSDTSVTSTSTGEIDNIAFGATASVGSSRSSFSDESEERRQRMKSGVNAERAAELDQMIDQGDWTGVVAAASRFSATTTPSDRSGGESTQSNIGVGAGASTLGSSEAASGSTDLELDRQRQMKEEEDALAQAEIWMAIAEQSKQEGQTDAGASDAADWAIARSLSALKNAEQTGELQRKNVPSDTGEAASVASSQDRSV